MGKEELRANVGVAQGSMISPALFDIYAESMIEKLIQAGWNLDDILAFADDHLIICDSLPQLIRAIKLIESWCNQTNIQLNPLKSGVLEIIPNWSKPLLKVGETISGIPIVETYRYLGLIMDNRLNGVHQEKKMIQKVNFLQHRLSPLLGQVSLDYRINLWKLLVRPLFTPGLGIMFMNTKSRVSNFQRSFKKSLKKFVGLSVRTNDKVLEEITPFQIENLSLELAKTARLKWMKRLDPNAIYSTPSRPKHKVAPLPKNVVKYNNIQFSECKICKTGVRNSIDHLKNSHNIFLPKTEELIKSIGEIIPNNYKKYARSHGLMLREKYVHNPLNILCKHVNNGLT